MTILSFSDQSYFVNRKRPSILEDRVKTVPPLVTLNLKLKLVTSLETLCGVEMVS